MTVRIENPKLDSTDALMLQVLEPILKRDQRVLFLVPAGDGEKILQRLRVMISRTRRAKQARGEKVRNFRFRSSIHPETVNGKRYDACVCWQETSTHAMMRQLLEKAL